ncbi:MAG: pyruvate dehydrogenase (acetyl-transferring), homodimeric type [Myxococcota bacterium]
MAGTQHGARADEPRKGERLPEPVEQGEIGEWMEALDDVLTHEGRTQARSLLASLLEHARTRGITVPTAGATPDVNTLDADTDPELPDEALERRIEAYVRWNAAVMVSRANRAELGVGGHIATYASTATLFEVGFNHFFRGHADGAGDQIYFQGHASPGIYARAFLEGRLNEEQLDLFRQETPRVRGGPPGLSSYPHPRLMPGFWEFPTVSMGLGGLCAVYQARFNRYLQHRGIKDTSRSRVWAFLGDGEMDEPETQGVLTVASREALDNLVFVVNCNLQRLDGPVRGNGKIISELESLFQGAGWNVIKVMWDRHWDPLFAHDAQALLRALAATPDGEMQTLAASNVAYFREHFISRHPGLERLLGSLSDAELARLGRGGHDPKKVYAAYHAATQHRGQPTVILAQTVKGFLLGPEFQARNSTHQMKKLSPETLKAFRDNLQLDISDEELHRELPPYIHPGPESEEVRYLLERRAELGGPMPQRRVKARPVELPGREAYDDLKRGTGTGTMATTMAFVRLLRTLMRHHDLGKRFVPIIPDEARTFGMDALFPSARIYSSRGQRYTPVDDDVVLAYRESQQGQILHEGITEAGSMGSFAAAGSCHATHGEYMVPVYIFYSMFGFQRTGDLMWSAADQGARGFLLGATAGRTTLNGEGLQHQDGHSLLLASTNPACISYDPAFSYEVAIIVEDGLRRMYGADSEDVFYYLTVYNEPLVQPPMPQGLDEKAVIQGMYRYAPARKMKHRATILASGVGVSWALRAQALLAEREVGAEVWSVTSWSELRREALACEEWSLLHPTQSRRAPFVTRALEGVKGPIVAVSDWMRAVPDQVARWMPQTFTSLGTDGFGRSDTRAALRRFFRVDAESIVVAVLWELALAGQVQVSVVEEAMRAYGLSGGV